MQSESAAYVLKGFQSHLKCSDQDKGGEIYVSGRNEWIIEGISTEFTAMGVIALI